VNDKVDMSNPAPQMVVSQTFATANPSFGGSAVGRRESTQFPRGRMGATAKKAIGRMATATAAAIVRMLTENANVESVNRDDTANDPARKRRPIAEASAMMNPITLLRRRSSNPDFAFWSDIVGAKSELLVIG
jgi:hypothetical protein